VDENLNEKNNLHTIIQDARGIIPDGNKLARMIKQRHRNTRMGRARMVCRQGGTETVLGERMLRLIQMAESPGPNAGVTYTVANMETVPNL
jgi:hypothetical protein